jgi:hypothetical protein
MNSAQHRCEVCPYRQYQRRAKKPPARPRPISSPEHGTDANWNRKRSENAPQCGRVQDRTRSGQHTSETQSDTTDDPEHNPEPLLDNDNGAVLLAWNFNDPCVNVPTVATDGGVSGIRSSAGVAVNNLFRRFHRIHKRYRRTLRRSARKRPQHVLPPGL